MSHHQYALHTKATNITQPQPVAFPKMEEQFIHWLSNGTISVLLASQNFITTNTHNTHKKTATNNLCLLLKRIEKLKFYIVFSFKQYGGTRGKGNWSNSSTKDPKCMSLELYIRMKKTNLKSNCQPMEYNGFPLQIHLCSLFHFCLFILREIVLCCSYHFNYNELNTKQI